MLLNCRLVALHGLRGKLEFAAAMVPGPATAGGYFACNYCLQQFSTRIDVPVVEYLVVIAGTLLVAALTAALQYWRAAKADPVRSLRYE